MYFDLTDEQKQLTRSVERLLSETVQPREIAEGRRDALGETLDTALRDLGVTAALAGEDAGGLDMGLLTLVAVAHHLGRHGAPGFALEGAVGAWAIGRYGTAEQKARWLPPLLEGRIACAFAFGEGKGAWTPDEWRASVDAPQVDKAFVRNPGKEALLLVGLREGLGLMRSDGAAFSPSGPPLDPSRPLASVSLPARDIEPFADRVAAWRVCEALMAIAAADAVGAAQRALEMAVDYAKTRFQFDRPIGAFQALRHQLANMAVDIAPAHFPCWYAAHAWDQGDPDARRAILMAKAHGTDMAVKVARAAVECHGGIAYTWEYPLHLLLKRAMQDRASLGSPRALRRAVARIDDEAWAQPQAGRSMW
jgi:alkylation response protein AidB-like acyl-CoA dehydrogenase